LPKPVRWSSLLPGVALCVGTVAAGAVVLVYGRVGAVHKRTIRIYLTTGQARGVIRGTDVWLDGLKVGAVRWLRFRPPETDTAQRLLIALDVIEDARTRIRRDARAAIRPGGSRIGSPVVQLDGGSTRSAPVADGDTLATRPQSELDGTREQVALAAQSLPVVLDNFNVVRNQLFSRSGTTGALSTGATDKQLGILRAHVSRISTWAAPSNGTLGPALDGGLAARAQHVIARADSLVRDATGAQSVVGRMRTDSSLVQEVRAIRSELAIVRARVDTAGRPGARTVLAASALRQQLADADARLRELMADIAKRPIRYLNF
jgi:ABC-type transporter Mla subunit MlaD